MAVPLRERIDRHGDVERLSVSVAYAGRPIYWASVHLVDGALVDSGPAHARPALLRFLASRRLDTVLTTHLHEDHVGNHEALPEGVRVVAPAATVELLERGPPPIPLYRRVTWGSHGRAPGAETLGDRVDTPRRSFRVVPAPGHSADHVAFLDEAASALYTGDAYLGRFKAARDEEDVHEEIATLRRLADLDAATMFPGHCPIVERPRAKLLDTAEHFERLARDAWRLADRGLSVRRIRRELLGAEPVLTFLSGYEFSCVKMVRNLLRRRPSG